jgi:hypothetical protein
VSSKDDIKKSLIEAQYQRASSDYLQFDQMMWQLPSVAITITSFFSAVSFNFIHNQLLSGVFLILGGVFDLGVVIELTKLRIRQDVRAMFLQGLEKEYGMTVLPLRTDQAEDYLREEEKKIESSKKPEVAQPYKTPAIFRRANPFLAMFYSTLLLSLAILLIGGYLVLT